MGSGNGQQNVEHTVQEKLSRPDVAGRDLGIEKYYLPEAIIIDQF